MKIFCLVTLFVGFCFAGHSQPAADPVPQGTAIIIKDSRIDLLGKKMAEYNEALAGKTRMGRGYRLMVISTDDREKAMQLRSQLYQLYPDQKQYMSYQLPNIKIKLGNFVDKADAEKIRKQIIAQKLVENNIYILPETVEIKPEKKDPSLTPGNE